MRASSAVLAIVASLAALGWAGGARADFKQSYAKGLDAVADGRWAEVDARMREALAEEGKPVAKMKVYGMRFEPYIPKYYLGLAAYRQGNCRAALDHWNDGATRGIVQGDAKLSGVYASGIGDCERKLASAPVKPPVTSPTTPPATPPTKPVADNTPPSKPPTSPPASPPPSKPPVTPPSSPVKPPVAPPTAPASAAPAALAGAVDALLTGRFEQVASLDVDQFRDNRARYHALLVRAAARHTLAQLRGEAGATLLAQAQADVRAAKSLDAARQPDAALFSPRFRQLYTTTR